MCLGQWWLTEIIWLNGFEDSLFRDKATFNMAVTHLVPDSLGPQSHLVPMDKWSQFTWSPMTIGPQDNWSPWTNGPYHIWSPWTSGPQISINIFDIFIAYAEAPEQLDHPDHGLG